MHMRRVVITGQGAVSPFGRGMDRLMDALLQGKSGVSVVPELEEIGGVRSQVAALVQGIDPSVIPRKFRRSMSRMSVYAYLACREALHQAGLGHEQYSGGRMGVVIGSTIGSPNTMHAFFKDFLSDNSMERTKSSTFFQIMNHSCAANVSLALGIDGRILALSSACATGCQAIGYGYEMVASGKQDYALCGGSDEFHPLTTATFDIVNAASYKYNNRPRKTPRPFDRDRDGIVCADGSGILLLESMESARERGASILAEVVGFATVTNTVNIASPGMASMKNCIKEALKDACIDPGEVDYINAHATATEQGDIAESQAIYRVFGGDVPVSSLKGHLGHTMAASGAIELAASVEMMSRDCLIPTLNLDNVDKLCDKIRHIQEIENTRIKTVLKNSFAFGGVNSSIILRRYEDD